MAESESGRKVHSGEILLQGLFRILQVVKIHQANNRLFSDIVQRFRQGLDRLWSQDKPVILTVYRGRFFLNDERIVYSPSMWATSVKMAEFFQERGINGLKFDPKSDLTDDEIVQVVSNLNIAKRFPDPFKWLTENLSSAEGWQVTPFKDEDSSTGQGGQHSADGGRMAVLRSEGEGEIRRQAGQIYSQALTVLRNLVERLISGKTASVQKSKRCVEELIDLMRDDFEAFMALSTVKDHGDQMYTHSANVTILSLALGQRLGYSRSNLEHLGLTAFLHDLGKAGHFQALADKSEALDDNDRYAVQNLTLSSVARVIRLNAGYGLKLAMLLPIGEHHLGVNLTGWPATNRRRPLSLTGRILAIADHYDAVTSFRPYRPQPLSPSQALREMLDNKKGLLDPLVTRVFAQMMGPWPVGSLLILDTRELAIANALGQDQILPAVVILNRKEDGTAEKGETAYLSELSEDGVTLKRRIVSCLNPSIYGLQPSEYLI
ncbi:MAG: HD domain-containing protein [Deltaproteobacteria bacterium]|nr:HD domain-containing protein [Deltaproteobacteria bacterium]